MPASHDAERTVALLRAALESASDGILVLDPRGDGVLFNGRFAEMWDLPPDLVAGAGADLLARLSEQVADPEAFLTGIRGLPQRPEASGPEVVERRDGRTYEREAAPCGAGPLAGWWTLCFRDATDRQRAEADRRRLEAQLVRSQRMEPIGRLAGGIAHDFNNQLNVIVGYADMVRKGLGPDDPLRRKVEEIVAAAERAATLTRQLLAFSRREVLRPQVLDLNAVLRETERMLRRLIGEDVELITQLAPVLGFVRADPVQMQQVLLQLAVDARAAMPRGGRLLIETGNLDLDVDASREGFFVRPGPYVFLAVTDSGERPDVETQGETPVAAREGGSGAGAGLASVYGIVQQSGGYVWVDGEPGLGMTFRIYLPRVEGATAGDGEAPPLPRATETILLVEDQDQLRALARESLEQCGYTVLDASGPREALRVAADHHGPLHLLLTDVVMPEMSGVELAGRLVVTRPTTKVLYMSGHTDEVLAPHGVLEPGVAFLPKPFTPESLAGKVREVLTDGC